MVINKHPLFILPPVTVWEDPYFYFDLRRKIWRVRLYYIIIDLFPLLVILFRAATALTAPPRTRCDACCAYDFDGVLHTRLHSKIKVLYHEVPGRAPVPGLPMPNIHKHCGGYAESISPDLWGGWRLSPPQCGAYTLDVDNFVGLKPVENQETPLPTIQAQRHGWVASPTPSTKQLIGVFLL